MDFLNIINPKSLFHAYCIEGQRGELFDDLLNFLEKSLSFETKGNPDFWAQSFETFGIDDARLLKSMSLVKSFSAGKKIFIISTDFVTKEAENAMLKIFEEPPQDVHFFILVSSAETLSPVLKSRLLVLKANKEREDDFSEKFLKLSKSERLKEIEKIILNKEKSEVLLFLNNLEKTLRDKIDMKEVNDETLLAFSEIENCRNYVYGSAPMTKNILEYIALITPLVK